MSGGGGPSNVTQTTSNNPPAYVQPYLQQSAQAAQNIYNQGPMQYYPGQTVTPFSSQTQAALNATQARAQNGSPLTTAAQTYNTDLLNGKYLNSNPYVDKMFNQAAMATQNQLSSQFAGAGRDQGAAYAPRSDQLNNLATQIYGGNYANERALQNTGLTNANSIANEDYTNLQALGNVGAQYEDLTSRQNADAAARYDYNQQAPGVALDAYIARLNNQPGGTSSATTPIFRNTGAGILGGAALGSQLGSSFNSSYGGGFGALLGGLLGGYS